jgi:hypothetical protein
MVSGMKRYETGVEQGKMLHVLMRRRIATEYSSFVAVTAMSHAHKYL